MLEGNLTGLKPGQIKLLEKLSQRKISASQLIPTELLRHLCQLSREIRRQLGLIIDRSGKIHYLLVGDDREILIPDLSRFATGRSGLRGLRCIHTHLRDEGLSTDDLTDLALLRLDLMLAVCTDKDGLPGAVEYAHILPPNPDNRLYATVHYPSFYDIHLDPGEFFHALDRELERKQGEKTRAAASGEKAILISVSPLPRYLINDSMRELAELARTAEVDVLEEIIQRSPKLHPRFLMGEGKLKEVIIRALQQGATLLIFDQDLSPAQARAIAAITDMKVVDRTQIILDIFARRAQSRDGKVQVELAQLKYILPRLSGKGSAMSRLMGGIGGRGPGETKLEIDRRRIRDRINRLEKQLDQLASGRLQRRQKRVRAGIPILSIVGYTNAGKSTLLNALTQSAVLTEDLLFATLDTSSRRLRFPMEKEVIITDTVGFIRELPKSLFGAFKATLEELEDADLLLHVTDISNPGWEEQIAAVNRILDELALQHIPQILVFNKVDKVDSLEVLELARRHNAIPLSAQDRTTFTPLMQELAHRFWPQENLYLD